MSYFLCDEYKDMEPYIPGEQPKDKHYIKLNANESPFPPSPKVAEAISEKRISNMRYYSDPHCLELREAIGKVYGVGQEQVFVGNGADEVLGFAFMSFFSDRMKVCFPDITYDFYRTYAKTNRIDFKQYPLDKNFQVKVEDYIRSDRDIILANPNNPTGQVLSLEKIEQIVKSKPRRMVIIDEAYVDYNNESAIPLVEKYSNLIVVQTFSKSRNLAGARIGFAIGSKEVIEDMNKIKFTFNPFNMGELTLAAGTAAVEDQEYFKDCIKTVIAIREAAKGRLQQLGFEVLESHTNFLMAAHKAFPGEYICRTLKARGILIRHYQEKRLSPFIRITIGLEEEMNILIKELEHMVKEGLKQIV